MSAEDKLLQFLAKIPSGARVSLKVDLPENWCDDAKNGEREKDLTPEALLERRRYARARFTRWLENEIARRPSLNFSYVLLDSAQITKRMLREGETPLRGQALHRMLKDTGFVFLGLIRGPDGPARFWSVYPEKFSDQKGVIIKARVRNHLDPL